MNFKTYLVALASLMILLACSEDDSDLLNMEQNDCKIAQGLSPNQDGLNDNFDLSCLADRTGIANLEIFNRNGLLVYEKANYRDEFVGQTSSGDDLVTGTYFYVIAFEAEDTEYGSEVKGNVYINIEQ